MSETTIFVAAVIVLSVLWVVNAYLLLLRPRTWIRWFVEHPWKSFGLKIVVEDELRFRRQCRFFGIMHLVIVLVFLGLLATVGAFG